MGAMLLIMIDEQIDCAHGALLPWHNRLNILVFYIVFRLKLYNQEK